MRSVWRTRFPLFAMRADDSLGMQTLAPLWREVTAGLTKLRETGIKGNTFSLFELRGDWKHHWQTFGLRDHWRCNLVCHRCSASKTDVDNRYWHFVAQPCWLQTEKTLLQFFNQQVDVASPFACSLLATPGFHHRQIRWCSMHCVNLGVALDANGSALKTLIDANFYGEGTLSDVFCAAWRSFKRWKQQHRLSCSQPAFKPWMLITTADDFCLLKTKA